MENPKYENSEYKEREGRMTKLVATICRVPAIALEAVHSIHYDEQNPATERERCLIRLESYLIAISTYHFELKETGQYNDFRLKDLLSPPDEGKLKMAEDNLISMIQSVIAIPFLCLNYIYFRNFDVAEPKPLTIADRLQFRIEAYVGLLDEFLDKLSQVENLDADFEVDEN